MRSRNASCTRRPRVVRSARGRCAPRHRSSGPRVFLYRTTTAVSRDRRRASMAKNVRMQFLGRHIAITAALIAGGIVSQRALATPISAWFAGWTMGGHDIAGTRSNPFEHELRVSNAGSLAVKWTATTGDVSATPAVQGNAVYFPDWDGNFWKLDARSGRVIWQRSIPDYVGIADSVSRTAPAIVGDTVYIGTQTGAYLLAIDADTGALRWKRQLEQHPQAILTQSPVVFGGVVYEGVS